MMFLCTFGDLFWRKWSKTTSIWMSTCPLPMPCQGTAENPNLTAAWCEVNVNVIVTFCHTGKKNLLLVWCLFNVYLLQIYCLLSRIIVIIILLQGFSICFQIVQVFIRLPKQHFSARTMFKRLTYIAWISCWFSALVTFVHFYTYNSAFDIAQTKSNFKNGASVYDTPKEHFMATTNRFRNKTVTSISFERFISHCTSIPLKHLNCYPKGLQYTDASIFQGINEREFWNTYFISFHFQWTQFIAFSSSVMVHVPWSVIVVCWQFFRDAGS